MKIAIHQPNFVPWYPFFQKMADADLFVILAHCQFEKNNYQNRFRFRDRWHTLSVQRGNVPITEKIYVNPEVEWRSIRRKLPEFTILGQFDECIGRWVVGTNTFIIYKLRDLLGIKTQIIFDEETHLTGTDRLVDICRRNGGTCYLAGSGGSRDYLEVEKFQAVGIDVEFQDPEKLDRRHAFEIIQESI